MAARGSHGSSTPYARAVGTVNCAIPIAPAGETASTSNADSWSSVAGRNHGASPRARPASYARVARTSASIADSRGFARIASRAIFTGAGARRPASMNSRRPRRTGTAGGICLARAASRSPPICVAIAKASVTVAAPRGFPEVGNNPPLALFTYKDQRVHDRDGLADSLRARSDVHRVADRRFRLDVLLPCSAARVGQAAPSDASRSPQVILGSRGPLARSLGPPRRLPGRCPVHGPGGGVLPHLDRRLAPRPSARSAARLVAAHDRARLADAGLVPSAGARPLDRPPRGSRRSSAEPRDRVRRHLPLLRRSGARNDRAAPGVDAEAQEGPAGSPCRRQAPHGRETNQLRWDDQTRPLSDLRYGWRPSRRGTSHRRRARRDRGNDAVRVADRRYRHALHLSALEARARVQRRAALRAADLRRALSRHERTPAVSHDGPLLRAALPGAAP